MSEMDYDATHEALINLRGLLERAAFVARDCHTKGGMSLRERYTLKAIERDIWHLRDEMLAILGSAADRSPKFQNRIGRRKASR